MQEAQSITLTADEYQQIISALAQRDPIIAALMQKQAAAQQAAQQPASQPAPAGE